MTRVAIRRALISVYDKTGLADLARALHKCGVEIVSTGSTAAVIAEAGVPVTAVEDVTGFPECLDGRVKTLHPAVHAGLLADLGRPEHRGPAGRTGHRAVRAAGVQPVPVRGHGQFWRARPECVEQIDIGGPAMVRAAAKNHQHVAVVTDPSMYPAAAEAVAATGSPWSSGGGWPPRRTRTPPATTPRWRPGSRPATRRTRRPRRPAGRT